MDSKYLKSRQYPVLSSKFLRNYEWKKDNPRMGEGGCSHFTEMWPRCFNKNHSGVGRARWLRAKSSCTAQGFATTTHLCPASRRLQQDLKGVGMWRTQREFSAAFEITKGWWLTENFLNAGTRKLSTMVRSRWFKELSNLHWLPLRLRWRPARTPNVTPAKM